MSCVQIEPWSFEALLKRLDGIRVYTFSQFTPVNGGSLLNTPGTLLYYSLVFVPREEMFKADLATSK